jgi:hypothetical protein
MNKAEEIWELVKKLPFNERSRFFRLAALESNSNEDKETRLNAVEEFLSGTKYRWIKTDRDEWHARRDD